MAEPHSADQPVTGTLAITSPADGTAIVSSPNTASSSLPPVALSAVSPPQNHNNVSSNTGELHCVLCRQPFFSKDTSPPRQGKPWRCNGCQQWFTVKSSAKRHANNVHQNRICRDCSEGTSGSSSLPEPLSTGSSISHGARITMTNTQQHHQEPAVVVQKTYTTSANAAPLLHMPSVQVSMAPQQSQAGTATVQVAFNPSDDLQSDLALLSLMLQNNLDLKSMDSIILLLNSGRDFSKIKNAAHWLERLGKGAAVNVQTNCSTCKRPATQACLAAGHTTQVAPVLTAINPVMRSVPQMQNTVAQVPIPNFPGTVIGIFDTASGQLLPTSNVPMGNAAIVSAPVNLEQHSAVSSTPLALGNVTPARPKPPKRPPPPVSQAPASVAVSPSKVGSLATSWKAVARNNLYSLHTAQELLGLCVVGRRVDKTLDTGLQPMDSEKRRLIAEAVSQHCVTSGIPVPGETQLNHFMSQILCDLRRKEAMHASGISITRKRVKKEEPQLPQLA